MERPVRKTIRLQTFDYSEPGYYFITFCTENKKKLLCDIVSADVLTGPKVRLFPKGEIADRQLRFMADFYEDIKLEKYVIMPNHIHLLIHIPEGGGPSGRPVPTNTKIGKFVGTFKRYCNKSYGYNIWQRGSYDHVIRGEADYLKIWSYIDSNPTRWAEDCFYVE